MERLHTNELKDMLLFVAQRMADHRDELCAIDGKIGDGDHGLGIERGFLAARAALEQKDFQSAGSLLREMGLAMLHSMGGASGVIFSAVFLGLEHSADEAYFAPGDMTQMCRAGLEKIKAQGRAKRGDKTMIDALEPAVEAMEQHLSADSFADLLTAAEEAAARGVEATKGYKARFGRAKFLGDRSIGFQDAGATSVYYLFKSMREWLEVRDTGTSHLEG